MKKTRSFVLSVVVLSAAVADRPSAQVAPTPPAGTIAAEMQQQAGSSGYGGVVDVTAVSTTLIAFDDDGHPVLDLRPRRVVGARG